MYRKGWSFVWITTARGCSVRDSDDIMFCSCDMLWFGKPSHTFILFLFYFISSLFELYAQIVSTVAVKAILQSSWSFCCRTHILFPSSLFRCSCGLFQLPLLCEFSRVCMCFYVVWSKYDLCSVHHAVNACLPRTVASGQTAHESIQFPHIATAN